MVTENYPKAVTDISHKFRKSWKHEGLNRKEKCISNHIIVIPLKTEELRPATLQAATESKIDAFKGKTITLRTDQSIQ